jgi:hypothetical protein
MSTKVPNVVVSRQNDGRYRVEAHREDGSVEYFCPRSEASLLAIIVGWLDRNHVGVLMAANQAAERWKNPSNSVRNAVS